jgi:predicted phosphodiesterase
VRVAIFSDVHGNLTALEAVLAHIDQQAPDMILFAGDLCLFGARPAACLEELRRRDIKSVFGNTDVWVIEPPIPSEDMGEKERRHRQHLFDISSWTGAQLTDTERAWLSGLPFEFGVSPTGETQDDLLVVHANPKDVDQLIFPTESKQNELFGLVKQAQTDEDLVALLEGVVASIIAFGHLHVPNIRPWRGLTLANISSVSLPGDGDPRAKYGLLSWEKGEGWSVQHQRIAYDVQKELDALAAVRPPNWRSYARRLETP